MNFLVFLSVCRHINPLNPAVSDRTHLNHVASHYCPKIPWDPPVLAIKLITSVYNKERYTLYFFDPEWYYTKESCCDYYTSTFLLLLQSPSQYSRWHVCGWKKGARLKLNLKALVKIGMWTFVDSKSRSERESLEWLQSKQAALLSSLPPVFTLRFQSLATVLLIDVCAWVCMYVDCVCTRAAHTCTWEVVIHLCN